MKKRSIAHLAASLIATAAMAKSAEGQGTKPAGQSAPRTRVESIAAEEALDDLAYRIRTMLPYSTSTEKGFTRAQIAKRLTARDTVRLTPALALLKERDGIVIKDGLYYRVRERFD